MKSLSNHRNISTTAVCLSQTPSSTTVTDVVQTANSITIADVVEAVSYVDPVPTGWTPAAFAELGIVAIHDAWGCPWYMAISGITFGLRVALLPLVIYQMKNVARLAWVQPELEAITKQWKAAGGYSAPPKITDGYQKRMKELFAKHNCNPARSLVGIFVQAPMFISFFIALRHMAKTYPSFQTGGILWFSDLSIADPTYALPVVAAMTMIATIELGGDTGKALSEQQASMKYMFRGLALFMIPAVILSGIPNAVFMYWLTANSFSLFQVMLFKIPGFKLALGIPEPPPKPVDPAAQGPVEPVIPQEVFDSRAQVAKAVGVPSIQTPSPTTASKGAKGKRGGRRLHTRAFSSGLTRSRRLGAQSVNFGAQSVNFEVRRAAGQRRAPRLLSNRKLKA